MSQIRNVLMAGRVVASGVLGNPGEEGKRIRRFGAQILDDAMDRESPIPFLTDSELDMLLSVDVTLPPLGSLERGNQSIFGLLVLSSIASMVKASTIMEIGTYNGITAYTLAANQDQATVFTLDLPDASLASMPILSGDAQHVRMYSKRFFESTEVEDRVQQLIGDSATFDFTAWVGKCQLVYVDGAHSEEYLRKDSETAFALLDRGGVVVWDDYTRGMVGVRTVLDKLSESVTLKRVRGSRLVVGTSDMEFWRKLEGQHSG